MRKIRLRPGTNVFGKALSDKEPLALLLASAPTSSAISISSVRALPPNAENVSPITSLVWVNFWETIGFTTNAGLRYHYKDRQYFRANLFLGQLYAKDPVGDPKYWDMGRKFNSFYTELAVKYEFMVWKEKKKSTVYRKLGETGLKNISIPTYLFIGAGVNFNVGKYSERVNEGKDVEEEIFTNIFYSI